MAVHKNVDDNKLAHYRAWSKAWLAVEPSALPPDRCLAILAKQGPLWLREQGTTDTESMDLMHVVISCFKTATKAQLVNLGGRTPPTRNEYNVLSENYDARVDCNCEGIFPVSSEYDADQLRSCGCAAIERMFSVGDMANDKEDEWNNSTFFTKQGLTLAMTELTLCHADTESSPLSCHGEKQGSAQWPEVRAPDRKPDHDVDLDKDTYRSLFPTNEHIRLSADAKYFFAVATGASLVDPGIQMAIADSGNDILIADYCDAATEDCLASLQKEGAAAFAFLKLCVYAGRMTDWQFDLLVAQVIQFRVIGHWRDHAVSRLPRGVYGSRMNAIADHRHVDLGIAVGIVSASLATGEIMTSDGYFDLIDTLILFNDLVDFRGDTWRSQRENVVLRGVRGCLCTYLDGLLSRCIRGAAALIRRGDIFALNIMAFCNWMLMGSGHKVYEIFRGTNSIGVNQPCHYKLSKGGAYEELLESLASCPTLGERGPLVTMKRKDLQTLYATHRMSPESHVLWLADIVRVVLHPDNLRQLVDVVHHPWSGELGDISYCA